MCVLVDGKTKNYQIYGKIILFFIFLHELSIFWLFQSQVSGSELAIKIIIIKAFGLIVCSL